MNSVIDIHVWEASFLATTGGTFDSLPIIIGAVALVVLGGAALVFVNVRKSRGSGAAGGDASSTGSSKSGFDGESSGGDSGGGGGGD